MELRGAPLLPLAANPPNGLRPAPAAPSLPQNAESAEIRRIAEEFESVFLAEMLSPMFDALDTEGLGGGGMGEQMFRPMLVEQYAESIARSGGIGLADAVVRELTRMQMMSTEAADGADR